MIIPRPMAVSGMVAGLALFAAVRPANAQVVDDLDNIGEDCSSVTTRVIGGVTVSISTQAGYDLTARTYDDSECRAFSGLNNAANAPLNPAQVSLPRFISSCGPEGGCFPDPNAVIFDLDAPVTFFQLTTIDLLELDCQPDTVTLTLTAWDSAGEIVHTDSRTGAEGPSGLALNWSVMSDQGDQIVKVTLTGANLDGCGGYGIDDLILDASDCDGDGIFDPKDVCPCVPAPGGVDAEGRPLGDLDSDCDVDMDDFTIMQQNFTGPN